MIKCFVNELLDRNKKTHPSNTLPVLYSIFFWWNEKFICISPFTNTQNDWKLVFHFWFSVCHFSLFHPFFKNTICWNGRFVKKNKSRFESSTKRPSTRFRYHLYNGIIFDGIGRRLVVKSPIIFQASIKLQSFPIRIHFWIVTHFWVTTFVCTVMACHFQPISLSTIHLILTESMI